MSFIKYNNVALPGFPALSINSNSGDATGATGATGSVDINYGSLYDANFVQPNEPISFNLTGPSYNISTDDDSYLIIEEPGIYFGSYSFSPAQKIQLVLSDSDLSNSQILSGSTSYITTSTTSNVIFTALANQKLSLLFPVLN